VQLPYTENAEPYYEYPAKATGNDVFSAYPSQNDWYETIKLNYGVDYQNGKQKYFYEGKPNTWYRMYEILRFWTLKGIDGFRCDMAEMVPVEFWDWVIPQIKELNPDVIFIAEVYDPKEYRNYLYNGKFDYLYDKVGLYDVLRGIIEGHDSARRISDCWKINDDIKDYMLRFLENHDEQRIASRFFANNANNARAAMTLIATFGKGPMMLYFGQEIGETGMDKEGLRSSIEQGRCQFGLCVQKSIHGNRAFTINTLAFYSWVTGGAIFKTLKVAKLKEHKTRKYKTKRVI